MDEPEIACGGFVVSGCQASGAFEFVEAAFDLIAQRVDKIIDGDWMFPVGSAWNDRRATMFFYCLSDMIGIIPLVGDENLRRWKIALHQGVKAFVIRDFTSGDFGSHGQAIGVGDQMNLGREATF